MARPWSARCYGVARQREGSRQNSIGGSGVLSLRHFSGWFSLSLGAWVPKNLARRRMVSAGAMLLDRLGPPGRCSGCWPHDGEFRFIDFRAALTSLISLTRARMARPWSARCYGVARQREGSRQNSIGGRVNLTYQPYARAGADGQAVVCPLLRGSSPTRGVAPKQIGGYGVLSLRHFGLVRLIPWRVGAEQSGAAKDGFGRRDAARPARAAWI